MLKRKFLAMAAAPCDVHRVIFVTLVCFVHRYIEIDDSALGINCTHTTFELPTELSPEDEFESLV